MSTGPCATRTPRPWYDYVEDFVGISGREEGLPQLPDGKFLPPMEFNCAEHVVREALSRNFGAERVLTMGRVAMLTREHRGRAPCHYCGPCERGCATRSYFSSLNATLPEAQATGRLTLRPHSVVESLLYDEHDVPNLFVTDGSAMTSSSCVNPSITYMMLTARACDYAVKEMDLGRI